MPTSHITLTYRATPWKKRRPVCPFLMGTSDEQVRDMLDHFRGPSR